MIVEETNLTLTLILISSNSLTNQVFERQGVIVVEGWLAFKATRDLAKLLVELRGAVEEAFVDKVLDPQGLGQGTDEGDDDDEDNDEDDGTGASSSASPGPSAGAARSQKWSRAMRAIETLLACAVPVNTVNAATFQVAFVKRTKKH